MQNTFSQDRDNSTNKRVSPAKLGQFVAEGLKLRLCKSQIRTSFLKYFMNDVPELFDQTFYATNFSKVNLYTQGKIWYRSK